LLPGVLLNFGTREDYPPKILRHQLRASWRSVAC
jgi:hypothetical protein